MRAKGEKNSGMNKYGTKPQKFTEAHVPQNKDGFDGKHEWGRGGGGGCLPTKLTTNFMTEHNDNTLTL